MASRFGSRATSGPSQATIAAMPPHDVYIGPFPGGGAIMRRRPPAIRSIGIDPGRRALEGFDGDGAAEPRHGCALRFPGAFPFQGRGPACRDPPHLQATRRSGRRCRHGPDDAAHVAPLTLLKPLDRQAMISGYPSRPCGTHPAGRRPVPPRANSHAAVVTGTVRSGFGPDRLHRASLAGWNLTHRQTVRRRAENRGRRHAAMPPAGRLAVLAATMAVEAG